jgi:hypothetical protein
MDVTRFSPQRLDHLGTVAGACRRIQFIEKVDAGASGCASASTTCAHRSGSRNFSIFLMELETEGPV